MSHICSGQDPTCLGCVARTRQHDRLRAALTIDDRLDDLQHARMWTLVKDRIEVRAPRHRWRRPATLVFATAAASVIAIVASRSPRESQVLTARADTTLTSRLGPHTRASLIGPARLEIVGTPGEATAVRLRSGTLVAEFEGGAGRSLHVEAPGLAVDVVGTLFAVEVRGDTTCVSVAHGRIRATTAGEVTAVSGGQRLCSDEPGAPRDIEARVRQTLARHEAVLADNLAPRDSAVAPPTPVATSEPVIDPAHGPAIAHVPDRIASTEPPRSSRVTTARTIGESSALPATAMVAAAPISPIPAQRTAAPAIGRAVTPPPAAPPQRPAQPAIATPPVSVAAAAVDASPAVPAQRIATPTTITTPAIATGSPIEPRPTAPAPPSADDLYRAAEAALAAHDSDRADHLLARVLAEFPGSLLTDQALYERALLAHQRHAWTLARAQLDHLAALPHSRLAEPGHYLACRIAVESRDGDAARCLTDYRATYPHSAHDLDILLLLVQLAHADGGCRQAASLVDELARAYPKIELARTWRSRCPVAR